MMIYKGKKIHYLNQHLVKKIKEMEKIKINNLKI
jgi:hypothetical protein